MLWIMVEHEIYLAPTITSEDFIKGNLQLPKTTLTMCISIVADKVIYAYYLSCTIIKTE